MIRFAYKLSPRRRPTNFVFFGCTLIPGRGVTLIRYADRDLSYEPLGKKSPHRYRGFLRNASRLSLGSVLEGA